MALKSSVKNSIMSLVSSEVSINLTQEKTNSGQTYRSYPQRWALVFSVALLNIANHSHWISYASVNSKAAIFYQVSVDEITRIVAVSYGVGLPFCLISTFVVAKYGLRVGIYIGGTLTFIGSLICCLSTFPGIREFVSPPVWYWASLLGQALTGIGSPFIACVPTKISQNWFEEKQRIIATTVLGLSNAVGLVFGQGLTPLFVQNPTQIPIMNIVWCVPSFVGLILVIVTVRSSTPPTPPSRSAELILTGKAPKNFAASIWSVCKNLACIVFIFTIGGAMGYISALEGVTEEIMSSLKYDNKFSGLCSALVFIGGIVGSFLFGILSQKCIKNSLYLTKFASLMTCLIVAAMIFVQQMGGQEAIFGITYTAFGLLSIGSYPLMLELAVEATYPVDETIISALLAMSSAIQGVIMLEMKTVLRKTIPTNELTVDWNGINSDSTYDYKNYIHFLNGYGIILSFVFLFFNPKLKRTEANKLMIDEKPTIKPLHEEKIFSITMESVLESVT